MRRAAFVTTAAALILALTAPAGWADPRSELEQVRQQIEALNSHINQAREESARVGEQLVAAEQRLAAVQAELVVAQDRVTRIRQEIAGHEARRDELLARIAVIEAELVETTARLRTTREDLEVQAVSLYMDASAATGALLLRFDSASDVAVGLAYAGGIASDSEDLLDTFEFLRLEEERQRAELEGRRAEVEEILAVLDAERLVLEGEAARLAELEAEAARELATVRDLLARLQAEIAAAEEHKEGLEADAQRLERELARLQTVAGEKPGILAWPVSGRLTSPYGYRVHPILGTRRLHTGIDVGAPSGSPIIAAGGGVVVIAGPFGGYGNAVVVDHGGGLATLYAHQSSIAVRTGQSVDTGETIGYVGCTGLCTGAHLHFETRENGVPVDPMRYLGG